MDEFWRECDRRDISQVVSTTVLGSSGQLRSSETPLLSFLLSFFLLSTWVPSAVAPQSVFLPFFLSFLLLTPPQPVDFDGEVSLFHFVLLRCVGKGAFGKACPLSSLVHVPRLPDSPQVRVVQHKQTRELYALKYINKTKCVKMKAVPNVIQERRLLEEVNFSWLASHPIPTFNPQVDHPFIVNLRYAFQDDENCFFVLDLMLGGDLRCKHP